MNSKGFSLVELLIILVIIGILATIVLGQFSGTKKKLVGEAYIDGATGEMVVPEADPNSRSLEPGDVVHIKIDPELKCMAANSSYLGSVDVICIDDTGRLVDLGTVVRKFLTD